ncbi:DUF2971 domain-containing protein [Subtercola boreus]|nr:DUF2971 domain-containing protein [Subtercola boreus]
MADEEIDAPRLVWHYTSTEGLLGIVQRHVLWATSAAFMNDAEELKAGATAFRAYFEERKPDLSAKVVSEITKSGHLSPGSVFDTYLLSASRLRDSLTMWRNYGGSGVAFAVGIDRTAKLAILEQRRGESHPSPPPDYDPPDWIELENGRRVNAAYDPDTIFSFGAEWQRVVYIAEGTPKKIRKALDRLVSRIESREEGQITIWLGGSSFHHFKNAGFRDEREVRLLFDINPSWKFVLHRPSRFGPVPYVEITSPEASSDESREHWAKKASVLPIHEIVVGPTLFAEDAKRSLRMLLDHTGYGHVKVSSSKTPYR